MLITVIAACTLVSDAEVNAKVHARSLQIVEGTPDVTEVWVDQDLHLILESLVAQEVGEVSGVGSIDTIDGTLALTGNDGWFANDADAFAFTVAEAQGVHMTATWEGEAADLDFAIFGDALGDGVYADWFTSFGDSYCRQGGSPESCATAEAFSPDTTYYLVALGYAGDGDEAYHVELEWGP